MKKTRYLLVTAIVVLLFATFVSLVRPPGATRATVTLALVTNTTSDATFSLTNLGPHSIFVSDLVVEIKTSAGWQTSAHVTPQDPRNINAGASKPFLIPAPAGAGPWRLRVVFGDEIRYPSLFVVKASVALGARSLGPFRQMHPGDTWWGSYSLSSAEIPK